MNDFKLAIHIGFAVILEIIQASLSLLWAFIVVVIISIWGVFNSIKESIIRFKYYDKRILAIKVLATLSIISTITIWWLLYYLYFG